MVSKEKCREEVERAKKVNGGIAKAAARVEKANKRVEKAATRVLT